MHFDDPSDAKDARLAIAALIARTKLDLTDAFGAMEREVKGDPVAFDERSKKALEQTFTDLPPQLLPEQKQFLRDELEEDRGLMLDGLRTAALERDRTRHNADLATVAETFTAEAEAEARRLGLFGELGGDLMSRAVHQGLAKTEIAIAERTDLAKTAKQTLLGQARSRTAEAVVGGTFEAGLAGGPDAAQKMIEDFLALKAPAGIDKPTQEAIARRLDGRLRDARNRLMLEALTAETEAAVERAQTFTELLVGAGEGTVGHDDVQASGLSPGQKARLAARVDARMAEDWKRHDGRVLVARALAGERLEDGAPLLDKANPDHRAAVDDYFENVLLPGNRDRVGGVATFVVTTAMMPESAETIMAMALSIPPDLGEEPKSGPGPAEQVTAASLVARLEEAAPEMLVEIDPRIRARAHAINKLIRSGTAPDQAPQRADWMMVQLEKQETDDPFRPPIGDADDPDEPPDKPFRPPIGDADDPDEPPEAPGKEPKPDDPDEPPEAPGKKPKPDDDKNPPRDKDRCLEEWLDARAATERLDAVRVALEVNKSQTKGFEAELLRLIKEIGLLRMDSAQAGVSTGRALARKKRARSLPSMPRRRALYEGNLSEKKLKCQAFNARSRNSKKKK